MAPNCYIFFSRPTCCTVEDLATDLRAREVEVPVSEPLPNDLPPKYDDLEQPPRYEDHIGKFLIVAMKCLQRFFREKCSEISR